MAFLQKVSLLFLALTTLSLHPVQAKEKKKEKPKTDTTVNRSWETDTLINPIHISRRLFTDKIEKAIDDIDLRDGTKDSTVTYRDENTTRLFTRAFMSDAPRLIILIENLQMEQNETIKYHKALQEKLSDDQNIPWDTVAPGYFTKDLNNLRGLIIAQYQNKLPSYVTANLNLLTLNNIELLKNNMISVAGYEDVKPLLYKALAKSYPDIIIKKLPEIKDQPYADTIIADIAQQLPGTILDYTLQGGELGALIKRNPDQLVQTIVRVAETAKKPYEILPFLGPINRGAVSISEAAAYSENKNKYFQSLVDLTTGNEQVCKKEIAGQLSQYIADYAATINNETREDQARFQSIQGLRDIDYYILTVDGKDLLSSNSFINGVFPLLMSALDKKSGIELLQQAHNYRFRTFVRLCAENDLLDTFLKTMTKPERVNLFKAFINNLELGELRDINDATEVANAFLYLPDENLVDNVRSDSYIHYERVQKANDEHSRKGTITYGLLNILFEYKYNKDKGILYDSLGANQIAYDKFLNDKKEIIEQVCFFTDKYGKSNFGTFISNIKDNSAYRIEESKYWVKITSNSGDATTVIYANKATSKDTATLEAYNELNNYLKKNNIHPVVIYNFSPVANLSRVVNTVDDATRVIMSGCSFGDDNLIKALNRNPNVHILAAHQISSPLVELKVFTELNKQLGYGRNLNWNDMWKDLNSYYTDINPAEKGTFNNFVQPNRNFGELFVMTYLKTLIKYNW